MSTTQQQSTAIMPFTETDLQSAGAVYNQAITFQDKYKAKQSDLLARATANGEKLSKELDDELMNWQVSAKKAVSAISQQRKPFTEKAHAFIKAFTAVENVIGKELYDPVQQVRDRSAKIHAQEATEAERKEREALAAKQMRIDTLASMETALRNGYASFLASVKETILMIYTNATLGNISEAEEAITMFVGGSLSEADWNSIPLGGFPELEAEVRTQERFEACANHFTTEVTNYAEYILSMLPDRLKELEQGVADNKAAEEMRKQQEKEAETARLEAEKRASEEAEKAKQQEQVRVLVSSANRKEEAPRSIESYSVAVSSLDGWRAIIEYYLSNASASAEDLGKVKLDSMRIFAERQAKSTGEMVTHSDVTYEPKYKAVARATKKKVA